MPLSATVTGKIGPGNTLTAAVYSGLTGFRVNPATNILTLERGENRQDIDITAVTTFTATYAGSTKTCTITMS